MWKNVIFSVFFTSNVSSIGASTPPPPRSLLLLFFDAISEISSNKSSNEMIGRKKNLLLYNINTLLCVNNKHSLRHLCQALLPPPHPRVSSSVVLLLCPPQQKQQNDATINVRCKKLDTYIIYIGQMCLWLCYLQKSRMTEIFKS